MRNGEGEWEGKTPAFGCRTEIDPERGELNPIGDSPPEAAQATPVCCQGRQEVRAVVACWSKEFANTGVSAVSGVSTKKARGEFHTTGFSFH